MIRIYGSSDDLIEIEGDISEEFTLSGDESGYIGLSDGTLLSVVYGPDGDWLFSITKGSGQVYPVGYTHDYTETFETARPIEWILFGNQRVRVK